MEPEDCPAHAEWLPADGSQTPAVAQFEPAKHRTRSARSTRPGGRTSHRDAPGFQRGPALRVVRDGRRRLHEGDAARGRGAGAAETHRGTQLRAWLGDIKQAGNRNILIDQDGRSLYYGIHINQTFVDFINNNGLTTSTAIQAAPKTLFFPEGVVELKTAWKDIDPADNIQGDYSELHHDHGVVSSCADPTTMKISEDKDTPRSIKVALVAMHVVYSLPVTQFVWTSFQHIDTTGVDINTHAPGLPDSAPVFQTLPTTADPNNLMNSRVVDTKNYLLYHGGTAANAANPALVDSQLQLDATHQIFIGTNSQTSIYRMYAGSKSNDINPDDAVTALNSNMLAMF